MDTVQRTRRIYLIGAVIVWVGIIIATAVVLSGTNYAMPMLAILGGGAFWFVVIVPGGLLREPPATPGGTKHSA